MGIVHGSVVMDGEGNDHVFVVSYLCDGQAQLKSCLFIIT